MTWWESLRDLIRHEPVMVRALIMSALVVLVSFGVRFTDNQLESIETFIVVLILFMGSWSARQQVTPVVRKEDE